jgi:hypothetical protein
MNKTIFLAIALAAAGAARAGDTAAPATDASAPAPAVAASVAYPGGGDPARMARVKPELAGFCLYSAEPAGGAKYTAMSPERTARETYGSVLDELPRFVESAKAAGGDAVIHYNGGQHFGFWPWRLSRPILTGTPIKWDGPAPDCAASGGTTFHDVMATNKDPRKK